MVCWGRLESDEPREQRTKLFNGEETPGSVMSSLVRVPQTLGFELSLPVMGFLTLGKLLLLSMLPFLYLYNGDNMVPTS